MLRRILLFTGYVLFSGTGILASDLELTGRVECRAKDETLNLSFPCPPGSELVFRTEDGRRFSLSEKDPRKAIFEDGRVRNELLRITARQDEEGRLALLLVHTLKNGRMYLPHYFCQVCNITAFAPGPCWCCQAEFEFREKEIEAPASGHRRP